MDLFTFQQEMTMTEKSRLDELETTIERGLQTFVDVGTALLEIRDSRLYRVTHKTFEDYCRERWGWVASRARQLIASSETFRNIQSVTNVTVPTNEGQVRPLMSLEPEQQREAWQRVVDTAPEGKITGAHVQQVVDEIKRPVSYHISDDSYEWYTPPEYIEAARGVMGSIDLDPASSDKAQETVKAESYYTKEDDGLSRVWSGNVWLNPPYNMPLIEQFTGRVIDDYERGSVRSAIVLVNNSTDTGWFHGLLKYPVCLTKGRIQFINGADRLATRQGQAIFYLGDNPDLFAKVFSAFGVVMQRYDNK